MSQALTLARPYARAAFVPRVAGLLADPKLSDADAVVLLAAPGASDTVSRFLALLADNRRMQLLPEVAGLYEELRNEAERVVKATVTSAAALPDAELEKIRVALRQRFGCEVELDTAIDESLIGGAVIDAGDVVIDGSLKGKLARLQSALAQ